MSNRDAYDAITAHAGYCRLTGRTQVELTGQDRVIFLHGLCTNDIMQLNVGQSCEAFMTNVQGKTVGYVYVHALPDSLVLETEPHQAEAIIESMDRYLIREDVELVDRSQDWTELLLTGPATATVVQRLSGQLPPELRTHAAFAFADQTVAIRRMPYCDETSCFLSCPSDLATDLAAAIESHGAGVYEANVFDIARIEFGTPRFGLDVSADNLPQEVDRNDVAISFTKGCYLGQETVARIDARGHVNRLLVGMQLDAPEPPAAGSVLMLDGKPAARVTSACDSPALDAPLLLAYVRRNHAAVGTQLSLDNGKGEVVRLPVR